jgi:hypothetical protein
MDTRITTKKSIEKAHFITATISQELFPLGVLEVKMEIGYEQLYEWGESQLDLVQDRLFGIPSSKFYKQIQYVVRTLEIDNDQEELLTVRFLFIGNINTIEGEKIGVQFRNETELNYNINSIFRIGKFDQIWDCVIALVPLNFYSPRKKKDLFSHELLELVLNSSMVVFPRIYFTNKLFLNPLNLRDYTL